MAALRTSAYKKGSPYAWPRGVECVIHYGDKGEYILNDRRQLDRIIVSEIGGLSGPAMVVANDKNPGRDGENPQDGTHGGRTITLRGYVEAQNLDRMRELFSYVLDAFDKDVNREKPLWLRYLDWYDNFTDDLALIDYEFHAGTGTIIVNSDLTGLTPTTTAIKELIFNPLSDGGVLIDRFTYGDGEIIIGFYADDVNTIVIGAEARVSSSAQKIRMLYDGTDDKFHNYSVVGGVSSQIGSASAVAGLTDNKQYYLKFKIKDNAFDVSIWDSFPLQMGGKPLLSVSDGVAGIGNPLWPGLNSGVKWGIYWKPSSLNDRVNLLDIGSIDKGDAIINCRKFATIEGPELQTDNKWRRPFFITLQSSSELMVSRKIVRLKSIPNTFYLTFPADGSGLTFPDDDFGIIFGSYLINTVNNLGRSDAYPLIRMYGQMVNPALRNMNNYKTVGINGTIAAGDYLEFDCANHTIFDSLGVSKYKMLTDTSDWVSLVSGINNIAIGADSVDGGAYIEFIYRHSSR